MNPVEGFDDVARVHLEQRINWCESQHDRTVTLAVIDSMTEAMALESLDPDKGTNVTQFYHSAPSTLTKCGIAVVIIDHVPKAKTKNSRWAIGSERKVSGLTGASYVFRSLQSFGRGRTGKVKVTVSKDRPGSVRPVAKDGKELGVITLCSDKDTGEVEVSFGTAKAETMEDLAKNYEQSTLDVRREMWSIIDEEPGINTSDVRKRVSGDNNKSGLVLVWLVENGYVRREDGPKNSKLHYTVNPLPADVPA